MSGKIKTRTTGESVEIKLNFNVPRSDFPVVEQALSSLLALIEHKVRPNNEDADALFVFNEGDNFLYGGGGEDRPVLPDDFLYGGSGEDWPVSPSDITIPILRGIDGLTQEDLAERLGVSQTRVSELESGKRRISVAMAKRLSTVFDIPYRAFL